MLISAFLAGNLSVLPDKPAGADDGPPRKRRPTRRPLGAGPGVTGNSIGSRFVLVVLLIALVPALAYGADKPAIRVIKDEAGRPSAFEAVDLKAAALEKLADLEDAQRALGEILAVYVAEGPPDPDRPPLAGKYAIEGSTLRFIPRFALRAGVTYRAVLFPERAADDRNNRSQGDKSISLEVKVPQPRPGPPAEVTAIFPSASMLPENQLRFYIHFSAAMARGEAYQNVRLLNSKGRAIDVPFLELGEELWDPDGRRFTLFIDPGRIKRGLRPREDLGPVLESGHEYTLVVDRAWHDASGRALRAEFRKKFRAGPPAEAAVDLADWKIAAPSTGSTAPLKVTFPRPLDHALMQRMITVMDSAGRELDGTVRAIDDERVWQFAPEHMWKPGQYELVIDGALEDLAGNRVGEQFEVDRVGPIEKTVRTETHRLPFEIR